MKKEIAIIGSWDSEEKDAVKGINVFEADSQSGDLKFLNNYLPELKCGSAVSVGRSGTLYFVDEKKQASGLEPARGGMVYSASMVDGIIRILSNTPSLATNPSYCATDREEKYLIVVHHTAPKDSATRIYMTENGDIRNEVIHDDAPIVLFNLDKDHRIDRAIDFRLHEKEGNKRSMLHAVYRIPESDRFVIFDKGLDRIYSYEIDNGKLQLLDVLDMESGSNPRYGVFHPHLPILYGNNERADLVSVIRIDGKTGKLKDEYELKIFEDDERSMASDIAITPDGKYLYCHYRMRNKIVSMKLDEEGIPSVIGYTDCEGEMARGIGISRNGEYLYCCNTKSDRVTIFSIGTDGLLKKKKDIQVSRPANIRFI